MHTHMQFTQIFIFLRELTPFFDFLTGKTRNNNFNCQFQTNTITPTNRFEYVCMCDIFAYVCVCVNVVRFCVTFATILSGLFPKNNFILHRQTGLVHFASFPRAVVALWKLCSITACLLPFWHLIEICYRRRIHQWYMRPSKRSVKRSWWLIGMC